MEGSEGEIKEKVEEMEEQLTDRWTDTVYDAYSILIVRGGGEKKRERD